MVLAVADIQRAVEQHVLEEVRQAGAPGRVVLGADIVGDRHRDGGRGMILRQDDLQTIVEGECLQRNVILVPEQSKHD